MIIENSKMPFGARISIIKDNNENYFTISTAKEGLFNGLSTMVMEGRFPSSRPCVKIIYSKSLRKGDRQGFHNLIAEGVDTAINEGKLKLYDAINSICGILKERGVISELINIANNEIDTPKSDKKEYPATTDLVNAISTNPVHAIKAHEEELQKYFDKSPEEGSEKLIAIYFEYLYLNFRLFDICALKTLGVDRRNRLLNFLDKPIARAAAEKYFEGDYDKNVAMILFNDNEAAKEYSQCEELVPPSERAFSEKAMSTKLSKRIDAILNNGEPSVLTSIHVLTGITFMHEHQRESDLAELIIKSAKEFEI